MADVRTYPATPAQLTNLANKLAGHGIQVNLLQAGEAKSGKWDIAWTIPAPATIRISMLSHPFAEEALFWQQVQEALTS